MRSRTRDINVFGLSALDLFASAMGAYVIIAVILFPYFQKTQPLLAEAGGMQGRAENLTQKADNLERRTDDAENRTDDALDRKQRAESIAEALAPDVERLESERNTSEKLLQACRETVSRLDVTSLDLVLAFDSSGSMEAPIERVKRDLASVVRLMRELVPDLRVGLVSFRDDGSYATEIFPLTQMDTGGVAQALQWLVGIQSGGGTGATAVATAIRAAAAMAWRQSHRAIVVVADDADDDAPSHAAFGLAASFQQSAASAHLGVIQIGGGGPKFFEDLALAGGGSHVREQGRMMESILLSVFRP